MMVRDRQLKRLVDMVDKGCLKRTCYWPRQDPGSFSQGVGYRTRLNAKGGIDWLCGRREINGCPHPKPEPQTSARTKPTEGSIAKQQT
jgi:hypothetical protein